MRKWIEVEDDGSVWMSSLDDWTVLCVVARTEDAGH